MQLSIVSYLDLKSSIEVRNLQQKLSKITGSKASLMSWEPHITVGDGIEVDADSLERFKNGIRGIVDRTTSFGLQLRDIATIDNRKGGIGEVTTPYVIYLDVKVNDDLLKLVDEVGKATDGFEKWYYMPQPFTPHCTLAFRDLSKEGFELGIEFFKDQSIELMATIDHIALVEKLPDLDRELVRFSLL